MKKVTIYTVVDKRPDFIPVQYETLKRFTQDDYEFIVVDNATDSKRRSRAIRETCQSLGIKYTKVVLDRKLMAESGQTATTLIGTYKNGSIAAGYAFNYIWKYVCEYNKDRIFVLIDSDMFPTRPISWNEELGERDAAFVYQYRGVSEDGVSQIVTYPWNALCVFNPAKIPNLIDMNWNSGVDKKYFIEGYAVDTAGYIHYWMKKNKINVRHISEYAIHDYKVRDKNIWIDAVLNGNFHYSFNYNLDNKTTSDFMVYKDGWQKFTSGRILPHFEAGFEKILILKTIKYFEKFLLNKQTYPHPSFLGLLEFETFDENIDPVTIHNKAGSGYMGFDEKYAKQKLDFIEKTLRIDQVQVGEFRKKMGTNVIMPFSLVKDYKRVYKVLLRKITNFMDRVK